MPTTKHHFRGRLGLFAALAATLLLCFSVPLFRLARFAVSSDLYSHILLMPFVSLYLIRLKRQELLFERGAMPWLAMFCFMAGAVVLAAFGLTVHAGNSLTPDDSLAFTTSAFLLFLVGLCGLFCSRDTMRGIAFPIGLLVFMIPFPTGLLHWIETALQYASAGAADWLFKLSGMPVYRHGLELRLPGFSLQVAPECSGIRSSLVLFIVSLCAGHLFLRSAWKKALLTLVVIPLAALRNGLRIFTIGQLCVQMSPEMIHSPIHTHGGPLFFVISLVPLLLLIMLLRRSDRSREDKSTPPRSRSFCKFDQSLIPVAALAAIVFLGAGCSSESKKAGALERANKYRAAGQYDKAEIEYMNVLKIDPANAQAIGRLGTLYFEQGRYGRAIPFLLKGRELNPEDLDLRLKLGVIYFAAGKFKEAREQAVYVMEHDPKSDEAPILLAEASLKPDEIQESRQRLAQVSPPSAGNATLLVAQGILFLRERDLKAAEPVLRQAVALDAGSSAAYSSLGMMYRMQNDLKQAEQAFRKAAELAPVRSLRRLQYAQFLIQTGNLAAGKQALEEIVQKTPDLIPASAGLAEIAFGEKNYKVCSTLIAGIKARDPENYEAALLEGRLELAQGDTHKAMTKLEQIVKTYPQSAGAHYHLALAYLKENEIGKAVSSLTQAVTIAPEFSEAVLLLADLRLRRGDFSPAIASLKRLIQRRPQLRETYPLLASLLRAQGSFANAIEVYEQEEKLFGPDPKACVSRGLVFLQWGKKEEARKAFNRALELAPEYLPALEQLVDLDVADNQFDAAMKRVQQLMDKSPKSAAPYLLQAKIFWTRRDAAQTETALLKAIETQPDSRAAYLLLAQVYVDAKKRQQALEKLNVVLTKNPKDITALMLVGLIHEAAKDYKEACVAYERLLAVNPNFSPAMNNLAYLYSEQLGQSDKAYELARRCRELLPYDPFVADTFGWILYKKGQYPWALSLLQESAARLPGSAEVQFHLGMTHYMLGEENPARAALQKSLQLSKEFPGRDEASGCLSVLDADVKTTGPDVRSFLEKRLVEQPDDPIALVRLAAIHESNGAVDKAIEAYQSALKTNPKNARAMINLAELYSHRSDDIPKAMELAKTAYKLSPEDLGVIRALGGLAYRAGDFKWALSLLEQAAKQRPDDAQLLYDLARARYSLGQVAGAAAAMQNALDADLSSPRDAEARRFLQMILLAGKPAEAQLKEAEIDGVLKTDPGCVPALIAKATANEQKGNVTAAKTLYHEALNRYPDFAPAKQRLALLYSQEADLQPQAYELATQAREALPNDPEVAKALGIIVFRRGEYQRAVSLLSESAKQRVHDGMVLYYLGMAKYQLKDTTGCRQALEQALTSGLSSELAIQAKRTLSDLR